MNFVSNRKTIYADRCPEPAYSYFQKYYRENLCLHEGSYVLLNLDFDSTREEMQAEGETNLEEFPSKKEKRDFHDWCILNFLRDSDIVLF